VHLIDGMPSHIDRNGFSLIELLIAVSIFALLLALAGPMMSDFMNNSQIRNAAEAMLEGVRQAQTTAIAANWQTQLTVTPGSGWQIQYVNPDTSVSVPVPPAPYSLLDGAPHATVSPTPPGATEITFDGFGNIVANPDTSATISCINVTNPNVGAPRNLRVVISKTNTVGATMLCDPAAVAGEPQACPAVACN